MFDVDYATTLSIVIKVELFERPLPMRFNKFGFQDQEDDTILETEKRSVRFGYVSIESFGSVPYSPPSNLQR